MTIAQELTFLVEQTGQAEEVLLTRALHVGIDLLYREAIEQSYIDGEIGRERALDALGNERLAEIDYAMSALAVDVKRGLTL